MIAWSGDNLAPRDRHQLSRLLLDHLGCAYRGACLPWGRSMIRWALPMGAAKGAGLFASEYYAAPSIAAFVNATAAHGLELDDTHDESVSHPGAAVIASTLALAQVHGAAPGALFTAIAAGYEVTGRLGAATNAARAIERGFHPTALFTGFGATTAAAKLLGLSGRQLARAWGLMLSMAGGSMQFSQEPEGTTVKRLHGGYAALHGVIAAEHVALGIEGPEEALAGRYGLAANFGADQDFERLASPHPEGPEIHRVSFKPYPCCRLFHSTLDALAEVTDGLTLPIEEIGLLRVGGPDILVTQHMLRRPNSEMAAQYSLPFTLGAALVYGPESVDGFMEASLRDPRILAIADRVEAEACTVMQAAFPRHFGSWVELCLRSGEKRRAEVLDSVGTPTRPMTDEDLCRKFDRLVQPTGLGVTGDALLEALADDRCRGQADMHWLTPFLSPQRP
jgi:2-methylcitrate dehydratase PrpD